VRGSGESRRREAALPSGRQVTAERRRLVDEKRFSGSPRLLVRPRVAQRDLRAGDVGRIALTPMEAPAALGVSDGFFRQHIAPELRWVCRGSKKLVSVAELARWPEREAGLTLRERASLPQSA